MRLAQRAERFLFAWAVRGLRFLLENVVLILVLCFAALVWNQVFHAAVIDFTSSDLWRYRGVWIGNGEFDLFGYTLVYQLEGYTDYTFYYFHWGNNMLRGVMPYSPGFGYLELDGLVNENGVFIFPPLTAFLYAIGVMIPVDGWGIGLLFAIFGYFTALPVYGIAKQLSGNKRIGEVAAFTYLMNPNVLYHTTFVWLNTAPFIFFFFSGFYMLTKGKRDAGTLLIVTAALFKQTALFLGIPLVIYLILRTQYSSRIIASTTERAKRFLERTTEFFDIRQFMISVLIVFVFVGAIMFPFFIAQPNMLNNLRLAMGGFPLVSLTELPGYGSPMRLQLLAVVVGMPVLAQILDGLVYYGFLLWFGTALIVGFMFLETKDGDKKSFYLRRLLLLTMILMLWVHLTGPRGVYKYYFTLFAPFFSIFSSAQMVTNRDETVPFSLSMLWLPIALSLMILLPSRNIYLFSVILILVGYALADKIGTFWSFVKAPGRYIAKQSSGRLQRASFLLKDIKTNLIAIHSGLFATFDYYLNEEQNNEHLADDA